MEFLCISGFFALIMGWSTVAISASETSATANRVMARVNGAEVREQDLSTTAATKEITLNQQIDFVLAVQAAKQLGLESSPELQPKIQKLLFDAFVEKTLAEVPPVALSPEDLQAAYDKKPLLRVRLLSIFHRDDAEKKQADKVLFQIRNDIKRNAPFAALVKKYPTKSAAVRSSERELRGLNTLPAPVYEALLNVPKNKVVGPIELDGATHFAQWTEKEAFTLAPATYLETLQIALKKEREDAYLASRFKELRQAAKIEYAPLRDLP